MPSFYTQRVAATGFPIVASAQVNPFALHEAAYLVDLLLAKRPEVREAMIASGSRLCILAWNEFTTDLPEWAWLAHKPVAGFENIRAKDYRDARSRGMGGSFVDPFCSCGEENLLAYPGDPYAAECILTHEFAHNIHLRGMANVDPTFDARLKAAYDAARKAGLWQGAYAGVNHHEYFAEGVQSWFDNNRENDHDHNHVNTRAELLDYDPGLAAMCREVFGDTELKYTKPGTRLTGHLAGYDPANAPTFSWPPNLQAAKAAIFETFKASVPDTGAGAEATGGSSPQRPRLVVLTDIGGDPDDTQSMVRLMTYANEFEIEGLIASASGTPGELKRKIVQPQLIRQVVEAYGEVRSRLALHAPGYPTAPELLDCIQAGNPNRGLAAVGEGHDTAGSN